MQNRILFKVIATGLNLIISIIIGILVPRAIGPSDYGNFSYIIATYGFIFQMLLLSSNSAYIYFLSNKKYPVKSINSFYFLFLLLISLIFILLGHISINSTWGIKYLWFGKFEIFILYLGLIFVLMQNLQDIMIAYSDSTRQTIESEKAKLISRFFMISAIILLIYSGKLSINIYFILWIVNFILFYILFFYLIHFQFSPLKEISLSKMLSEIYSYIRPLIIFTLVAATYAYLGKYLLQIKGGSIEQGYYGFAYQLALIPVTFISALMTIYLSEMTRKFKEGNILAVKQIFLTSIFKIYAIHAFISLFIIINAKNIILFTVGEQFIGAIKTLQILSIFSLLHTFGTLSRNVFFSSSRTKEYSIINTSSMIIGISYLFFILKTGTFTSVHLALVMVVFYGVRITIQLISNIIFLEINAKFFLAELFSISMINFFVLETIFLLHLNILLTTLFSLILIIFMNFIFNDYLEIKKIIGKKNE